MHSHEEDDTGGLSIFGKGSGQWEGTQEGTQCPVCMKLIPGDVDVVEAHIDSCLAHESTLQLERESQERLRQYDQDAWGEVNIDGETRIRLSEGDIRGKAEHFWL